MSDQTTTPTSAPIPMDRAALLARIDRIMSHCESTTMAQTDPKAVGVGARGFAAVAELYGKVAGLIGATKIEHGGSIGIRVASDCPSAAQLQQAGAELALWREEQAAIVEEHYRTIGRPSLIEVSGPA